MTHYTPLTQKFLSSILSSIDCKDPVVANAWLDTLLDVIDLLPAEVLNEDVLKIALCKAQVEQPVFARLGACQLIGKLGSRLEAEQIELSLLPLAVQLSKDDEWAVRASIVAQVPLLVKGVLRSSKINEIDSSSAVACICSVLSSLSFDDEEAVRMVCVESSSSLLSLFDKSTCQDLMIPLIRRMAEQALQREDKTLPVLAQHWARVCFTIQGYVDASEKDWFSQVFRQLAVVGACDDQGKMEKPTMPDIVAHVDQAPKWEIYVETRHCAAVNLPAMISFIGAKNLVGDQNLIEILAADPVYTVRRAVSANMLEICHNMGFYAGHVYPTIIQLLVDPFSDVITAMVPSIGAVIEHLARLGSQSPFSQEKNIEETCNAVLRCEEQVMSTSSWRLQADILAQLAAFPLCIPCQTVQDCLVPRLWHRINTSRPLPCRVTAAQTLMLCVRSERRCEERDKLCSKVVNDLIQASSCHKRLLFLKVCPLLMDLISRRFFRKYFFIPVVGLASDKVANVRMRFCSLLPLLHRALRGANRNSERFYFTELENALRRLGEQEKDRDVLGELEKYLTTCSQLEKESAEEPEDLEDAKKEKEEELLVIEAGKKEHGTESSRKLPLFVTARDSVPREVGQDHAEKMESLDPSTDEFYRDAGIRLSSPSTSPVTGPSLPLSAVQTISSRIPSGSGSRRSSLNNSPGNLADASSITRLRLPAPAVRTTSTASNFGLARAVHQVAPRPVAARDLTTANSPPMRVVRKSPGQLNSSKSRSQENLALPPKPRTPRPVSMLVGNNQELTGTKLNFTRNRFRASIGAVPNQRATPIRDTQTNQERTPDKGKTVVGGFSAPVPSRKITLASAIAPEAVNQSTVKQVLPPRRQFAQPVRKTSAPAAVEMSTEDRLEEAAADMLAALQSTESVNAKMTRLRKPSTGSLTKPGPSQTVTRKDPVHRRTAAAAAAAGAAAGFRLAGSCPSSPQNSRPSSPDASTNLQRRSQWRRSAHFTSSTAATPPPPPPRRSLGPRTNNNNPAANNNNNNSNTTTSGAASKLPVFSSKRNGNVTLNYQL